MADPNQLKILHQGVLAWNQWRKENPGIQIDLSETRLAGELLQEANLSKVNLTWTNLDDADLRWADLSGANLTDANFRNAQLQGADLSNAILSNAVLCEAELSRADLRGADLSKAAMRRTVLVDIDLSTTKGLETVEHDGPSSIGIDTIYRSQGKIPEGFLRGAGVPDSFITYMRALVSATSTAEFYSCFISYSTQDQVFAERLHADLQAKGIRCWFAPSDLKFGRKIHEQLDQAIRIHDKVLLILSSKSMNSEWVRIEIAKAREREIREKRPVLFPISLVPFEKLAQWKCWDEHLGRDLAKDVREYVIPDFANWKDSDSYHKTFSRLVKELTFADRFVGSAS